METSDKHKMRNVLFLKGEIGWDCILQKGYCHKKENKVRLWKCSKLKEARDMTTK